MHRLPLLVALSSFVASCATAGPADDLAQLRGCWIERRGEETLTMRWRQEASSPGDHAGDMLVYRADAAAEADRFILRDAEGGFLWIDLDLGMPHGPPAQPAVVGAGPPADPESTWVRITPSAERLRIAIESGETSSPIFEGVRDGCD
jgi:hypothetical protein